MRNALVPGGGLGLCSQGIYSLATASQMDCFARVRQFVAAIGLNTFPSSHIRCSLFPVLLGCMVGRIGSTDPLNLALKQPAHPTISSISALLF